jgi:riboflavin transport system substrate-binding protein
MIRQNTGKSKVCACLIRRRKLGTFVWNSPKKESHLKKGYDSSIPSRRLTDRLLRVAPTAHRRPQFLPELAERRGAGKGAFISACVLCLLSAFPSFGEAASRAKAVAIFVPGVVSGSPIYEMLVQGVRKAVDETPGAGLKVVEGGFVQADWKDKLTALVATGDYGLVVTSNPAMPEICDGISAIFPVQKFLAFDGYLAGNKNVKTVQYNQREQGYFDGFLAALMTKKLVDVKKSLRVGLIAGQEYPAMNDIIKPGFEEGAKAVDASFSVDFRVIGNWYDAGKATALADEIFASGAEAVLCVAGGANQGVLASAKQKGKMVLWFDDNGYAAAPGTVVGCAILRQDKAAYDKTKSYFAGKLDFGAPEIVGLAEGFVDFIQDDPLYLKTVPADVRKAQAAMLDSVKSGSLRLPVPASR